ncbi:dihydrofolate reductase family protein [Nocardia jejuensis]|uniref:dihydrofolate reductase family protein n=1 Tax=Nocardia jejuensis TaxID=328049 RepID=UPI000832CFF9|nr:dihydrofolate reductase family protein [Nocardia jejuensis]
MTHTVFYTATTLDGFIATPDHSLEWLLSRKSDADGPMGYNTFLPTIGAIAMGASTYQWLLDNSPAGEPWPYTVPTWIFTHRTFPARTDAVDVRFTHDPIPEVHERMSEAAGDKHIWIVGGGDLAGQFADHTLLDEIIVSIAPVTLGSGQPLLPRLLELKTTEVAHNGEFAAIRYEVLHP